MAMREDGRVPGGKRICLCIAEDDLRSWVTEELLLITWVVQPAVATVPELAAIDPTTAAVIVVDRLASPDLELLRRWAVPVIVIGADPGLAGAVVLGPKLTSRELKQAIRATVLHPPESRESAVV